MSPHFSKSLVFTTTTKKKRPSLAPHHPSLPPSPISPSSTPTTNKIAPQDMASSTETVSPSSVSDGKTNSHPILVIVNMAGQKPLRVNVQSTDSVDSLKAAISEVRDISPASQKLIFKGKKLESGTLEQNKLQKKAAVLLVQIQEKEKEDKGEAIRCEGGCGFWG